MRTHQISVTVESSSIKVSPETLVMTAEDEVQWNGTNASPFSIVFDGASPFATRELAHAAATTKQRPRSRGRFKYSVISAENPSLRLDPEIIVEDPPTGKP
jgi:hypothetical protein